MRYIVARVGSLKAKKAKIKRIRKNENAKVKRAQKKKRGF